MGRFRNTKTGAVVSVDDAKGDRFSGGEWEPAEAPAKKAPARKPAAKPDKS